MLPGDVLCILGAADMSFVSRKEGSCFRLIGECYVDDLMNGEVIDAANDGKSHRGPFALEQLLDKLFNFDTAPEIVRESLSSVKRDVFEAQQTEYKLLRERSIELC